MTQTLLGFHVPSTWRHWGYVLAAAFIGAAAGSVESGGNWHVALTTGATALAGLLKVWPLPGSPQPAGTPKVGA